MFFTLSKTGIIILATLNLSSAHAVNLAKAKILSFGKELRIRLGQSYLDPHSPQKSIELGSSTVGETNLCSIMCKLILI